MLRISFAMSTIACTSAGVFVRHTDEEIKTQVEDVALQCLFKNIVEAFARDGFVDDFLQMLRRDFRCNGNRALFTIGERIEQRRAHRLRTERSTRDTEPAVQLNRWQSGRSGDDRRWKHRRGRFCQ